MAHEVGHDVTPPPLNSIDIPTTIVAIQSPGRQKKRLLSRCDTTPSPKPKQKLDITIEDGDPTAQFFYDHATNTPVMLSGGQKRDADNIVDDEGFIAGMWMKSAGLLEEVWIKWASEITFSGYCESMGPTVIATKKGGTKKRPAASTTSLKRPSSAMATNTMTKADQEFVDEWIDNMIRYENSVKAQELDRRVKNIHSRIYHKLAAQFVRQHIPLENILSQSVAKCMSKIRIIKK